MNRRGYGKLRFAAVSALVVLALTGFSTGSHHGVSKSSGKHRSGSSDSDSSDSGGGGCSSSSQDHDGSSSSSGGSGSSSTTGQDAEVELVDCATKTEPYATLRLFNPNSSGGTFTVTVDFLDADSHRVEQRTTDAYVPGKDTATVQVKLSSAGLAAEVDHCEPEPYAPAG
ncbi:hypothetical protein [Streptomyces sp. T028]|uniref:hypothetical protein n=1 Tax=Streptomyces sp. T028 TaxID=3394379 RepID=UPI003A86A1D1